MKSLETLISLVLIAPTLAQQRDRYRSFNGTGNNLKNPTFGLINDALGVLNSSLKSDYTDGKGQVNVNPNPRVVSNTIADAWAKWKASSEYKSFPLNPRKVNELRAMVGQFVSHDMFLLHEGGADNDVISVPVPVDDLYRNPEKDASKVMTFGRSGFRLTADGVRVPVNKNTAFLDGSAIYGTTDEVARSLRDNNGTSAKFRINSDGTVATVLATDTRMGFANIKESARIPPICPASRLRQAGDHNANVGAEMLMVQTLFVREHNRLVDDFARDNPTWDNEKLYQEARRMNVAFIQRITDREYLPALLGKSLQTKYQYNPDSNPQVTTFMASVAFRYGHSELNSLALRLNKNFLEAQGGHLSRSEYFFCPDRVFSTGVSSLFRGLACQVMRIVSPFYVDEFRNHLFANPPGTVGDDLLFVDVMRGRDHGVPRYNECRKHFGLAPKKNFDFLENKYLIDALNAIYPGGPDEADSLIVGLAEPVLEGSGIGELFTAAIIDHFTRIRDGDWYWYANTEAYTDTERKMIEATSLSMIIKRNFPDLSLFPSSALYESTVSLLEQEFQNATVFPVSVSSYQYSLQSGTNYNVSWSVDKDAKTVSFMAQIKSNVGWVGVGFVPDTFKSEGLGMVNSDVVIATIVNGKAEVRDYYVPTFGNPIPDEELGGTDDVTKVDFEIKDDFTVFKFTKPFASGDKYDITFEADQMVRVILAFGSTYEVPSYHGSNRASQNAYIIRNYKSATSGYAPVLMGIAIAALLVSLVLFAIIIWRRNKPIIRATGWRFALVILIGVIFCLFEVIASMVDSTTSACSSRRWLFPIGFSLTFSALLLCQWRLRRIFNNKKISSKAIKDSILLGFTAICVLIDIIILIIWHFVSPSVLSNIHTDDGFVLTNCDGSNDRPFIIALYVYNAIIVVTATYFAFLNRNITSAFNESVTIGYVVFNAIAVGIIVIIVENIAELDPQTTDVLSSVAILYASIFLVIAFFGLKAFVLIKNGDQKSSHTDFNSQNKSANAEKALGKGRSVYSLIQNKKVLKETVFMLKQGIISKWVEVVIYGAVETGVLVVEDPHSGEHTAYLPLENVNCNMNLDESVPEKPKYTLNATYGQFKLSFEFSNSAALKEWNNFIGSSTTGGSSISSEPNGDI